MKKTILILIATVTSMLSLSQSNPLSMATTVQQMASWDRYPTFSVYCDMMKNFANDNPDFCHLDTIGYSHVGNRPILGLVITNNITANDNKPRFFWSSTMHGDELTGWILSMRFADELLSKYNSNDQIKNLMNNAVIYICPMANPDGTYYKSSEGITVETARRENANGIDLNRNFPRPDEQTVTMQSEIQCMIDYASKQNFTMSANLHTGAEVVNYPWDVAKNVIEQAHADDNWWQYVSHIYADNVINDGHNGYFGSSQFNNGITEGREWYPIDGSRQDYMNYFQHCREVTIEISNIKSPNSEKLPDYWEYNRQAMLDYTEQVIYGFRGIVTDQHSGNPISDVKVEIVGHDYNKSEVYTFAPLGNYFRPIYEGSYQVTFSKAGCVSQTIPITVTNNNYTIANIQLSCETDITNHTLEKDIKIYPNPTNGIFSIESEYKIENIEIFNTVGIKLFSKNINNNSLKLDLSNFAKGQYFIIIKLDEYQKVEKIIVN